MNKDYQALSAEQLAHELEYAGRTPDLALIRECMARRAELVPLLLEMLAGGVDDDWDEDDPRWYREVHAGLLLIHFRAAEALPIFAKIMRDDESNELMEWFGTELAAYGPAATPMLLDLLNDEEAYIFSRITSTDMLAAIAWHHPAEQERIVPALVAKLPPLDAAGALMLPPDYTDEDVELWSWVVCALADLKHRESEPQITALYRAGLIDEFIMSNLEAYKAELSPDAEPPVVASYTFDVVKVYERLHREAAWEVQHRAEAEKRAAQEATRRAVADQRAPEPQYETPQPFVRAQSKVGRNDPCPCGSGRKYKHCCGKNS